VYYYQQDWALKADLAFAQQIAKSCGLPDHFVRLDKDTSRFQSKIRAGLVSSACVEGELAKSECFEKAMKKAGRAYEDVDHKSPCAPLIPIP
jgi:hypothetical protein